MVRAFSTENSITCERVHLFQYLRISTTQSFDSSNTVNMKHFNNAVPRTFLHNQHEVTIT